MKTSFFSSMALVLLIGSSLTQAFDKKAVPPADKTALPKDIFKVQGKLVAEDPADPALKGSKQKVHPVKLDAGKYLRFELISPDFDTYLRLLDEDGKTLAEDDDGGDTSNSRIVYKIKKPGNYKLVVANFDKKLGAYTLTVTEAGREDVLAGLARSLPDLTKEERTSFLADVTKFIQEKGAAAGPEEIRMAMKACLGLEKVDTDLAAKGFEVLGGLLLKSTDKGVVKTAEMMQGASRRLQLIGKDMDIKGAKMDGKPIDWKSYRGKIVLVDFWATWCIKCKTEFPGMKKNLELYKDRFDVVGVSLDQSHDELEDFLQKEKLPWVCIHEKLARNGQPLANYYGVMLLPQTMLVGTDGKVIALNVRGEELDKLLAKHLGPAKGK